MAYCTTCRCVLLLVVAVGRHLSILNASFCLPWIKHEWAQKPLPYMVYDVEFVRDPSPRNHGSGKWVPPILVSFHLG